jgi:threonine dehydratase
VASFLSEHGAAIHQARERIAPWVRHTPSLLTDLDSHVVLKAESLRVTGSFKPRGAFNAILSLRQQRPETTAVCSVSSGNHAQAVAYAARMCGLGAVVVIPEGANPLKVSATKAWGAEVVSRGVTFDNREDVAAQLARERGIPMVHPFDDWSVIHGQGTIALELLDDCPDLAAIVAPVGGGGMLSGIALAVRHAGKDVAIIGVEPEVADDAARSMATRTHQRLDATPATLADGVKVLSIGERSFEVFVTRGLVDAVVTVSEAQLRDAVNEVWRTAHLFIEPTAALPLAAYRAGKVPPTGDGKVALVLSGGNADPTVVLQLLA